MAQAGETAITTAQAARTGLRTLKRKAEEVSGLAEQKLTERGLDPEQLGEAISANANVAKEELVETTRRARKRMAKNAERTRKELAERAKQAQKEAAKAGKRASKKAGKKVDKAASKVDRKAAKAAQKVQHKAAKSEKGKRRKWPWLLGIGVAAAATAYVVRSRSAAQNTLEQDLPQPRAQQPSGSPEHNGSGAHAREESQANKNN